MELHRGEPNETLLRERLRTSTMRTCLMVKRRVCFQPWALIVLSVMFQTVTLLYPRAIKCRIKFLTKAILYNQFAYGALVPPTSHAKETLRVIYKIIKSGRGMARMPEMERICKLVGAQSSPSAST